MGVLAAALGAGLIAGGGAMSANSASKKRKEMRDAMDDWLPDIGQYQQDYFRDLGKYEDKAIGLSNRLNDAQMTQALKMRESVLPGFGAASQDAMRSIAPLLRGELPQGVMSAFQRAGGASTLNSGFGGSGFGALNTGLFGARGAMGAIQTGMGLLPSLLGTMPAIQLNSPTSFLAQIMSPLQRTQTQLNIRGQNIGLQSQMAQMPTSTEIAGNTMGQIGGMLMGGMGGGMGGMMGGSSGFSSSGATAGGYGGGGFTGGFGGPMWGGSVA